MATGWKINELFSCPFTGVQSTQTPKMIYYSFIACHVDFIYPKPIYPITAKVFIIK